MEEAMAALEPQVMQLYYIMDQNVIATKYHYFFVDSDNSQ